jgi:phosphoribosylglycinamide formyltransferase
LKQNTTKTREGYDAELARIVLRSRPDLVVLAGWMHILSDSFLELLDGRKQLDGEAGLSAKAIPVINLHPALPGQFDGANAIERAFEAFQRGEITHSGAMVHRVVKDVDRGEPVIVREIPFVKSESIEEYEARLHEVEHEIIVEGTRKVLEESGSSVRTSDLHSGCCLIFY